jgi:hypothetical protein|tara:strand:- start:442 stop:630 length:189 start_codon:yes stop_codon:yes gene_type:complete
MSVIYLTHPVHGAKVAIAEEEAIYDESHGWMRYDIDAAAEDKPVNKLAARPRGRPRQAPRED